MAATGPSEVTRGPSDDAIASAPAGSAPAASAATDAASDAGKILLLDGHSLAYRAFFALPVENFSTSTGQPTNAVYGFTSMLINVLRDEKPSHIVVAFDVSRTSFRTERYAEYKAGRATTPTDFTGQVALVKEVLAALRIPVVEAPGYEADDAIATLTREARAAGLEVLICSGDRDAFQLVGEHTTVLYPIRGVSELSRMTPDAVEARYGIGPQQYRDLAALVGESSDNLPGIAGVGPKTAAKWIITYGGLEGVVAHADEIKGKAGDGLRAGLADVLPYEMLGIEGYRYRGSGIYARHSLSDGLAIGPSYASQPTARLDLPSGHSVHLVCVHPHPPAPPWYWPAAPRWRQELAALPGPNPTPVVLAGDFNATLDHAQFRRLLRMGHADAARQVGRGLVATWAPAASGRPALLAFDHVLVDPRCAVLATATFTGKTVTFTGE